MSNTKNNNTEKNDNSGGHIDFISLRYIMIAISIAVIIGEIVFTFATGGFNLGIDFKPGISLDVNLGEKSNTDDIVRLLEKDFPGVSVISTGSDLQNYNIKISDDGKTQNFQDTVSKKSIEILSSKYKSISKNGEYYIGPSLSTSSTNQIAFISSVVLVLILIYVAFRFHWTYAVGAVIALFHDGVISLFFIGVMKLELSIPIIVSIITIIGYSLNDTIVIFDRIRENVKLEVDRSLAKIINISINSTLKRSLLTSFTTLITMVALVFYTKGDVKNFALTMIVGIIVGTYSSVFIASPILLFLKRDKAIFESGQKTEIKTEVTNDANPQESMTKIDPNAIDFDKERKRIEQEIDRKKKK